MKHRKTIRKRKVIRQTYLLTESLATLERMPCQFWACEGPTLKPIDMVTCYRCALLATVAQHLGVYLPKSKRTHEHKRGKFLNNLGSS